MVLGMFIPKKSWEPFLLKNTPQRSQYRQKIQVEPLL